MTMFESSGIKKTKQNRQTKSNINRGVAVGRGLGHVAPSMDFCIGVYGMTFGGKMRKLSDKFCIKLV